MSENDARNDAPRGASRTPQDDELAAVRRRSYSDPRDAEPTGAGAAPRANPPAPEPATEGEAREGEGADGDVAAEAWEAAFDTPGAPVPEYHPGDPADRVHTSTGVPIPPAPAGSAEESRQGDTPPTAPTAADPHLWGTDGEAPSTEQTATEQTATLPVVTAASASAPVPASPGAVASPSLAAGSAALAGQPRPDSYDGASPDQDEVPRRSAGTHLWTLLATVLLVPVAWYLVSNASAQLTDAEPTAWESGSQAVAPVVQLIAGIVLAGVVVYLARNSTLGAWVVGIAVTLAGLAWIVVPGPLRDWISPALDWVSGNGGSLGRDATEHLVDDGTGGHLLFYGALLLALALTVHTTRRVGRAEGAADRAR